MRVDRRWLLPAAMILLAACSEPGTSPVEPQFNARNPHFINCPTDVAQSTSSLIGPLGGIINLAGTSISIPANAVPLPTLFTVSVPASPYMRVDISADDVTHYVFQQPVTVTIDYSRCRKKQFDHKALNVWYVDDVTAAPLENMGGTDDKDANTITFTTPHLSGYVIAD